MGGSGFRIKLLGNIGTLIHLLWAILKYNIIS